MVNGLLAENYLSRGLCSACRLRDMAANGLGGREMVSYATCPICHDERYLLRVCIPSMFALSRTSNSAYIQALPYRIVHRATDERGSRDKGA